MTDRPICPETVTDLPERQVHTMQHMRDSGLLWFINRSLFHPIGYALSLDGDDWDGWCLHYAGGEVVHFGAGVDEDAKLAAFQQLLATARAHRVSPPDGIPSWPTEAVDQDAVVEFAERPSVDAMRHLRHVHVAGRCVKRSAGPHCEETR